MANEADRALSNRGLRRFEIDAYTDVKPVFVSGFTILFQGLRPQCRESSERCIGVSPRVGPESPDLAVMAFFAVYLEKLRKYETLKWLSECGPNRSIRGFEALRPGS
jgi:hypothetical protein